MQLCMLVLSPESEYKFTYNFISFFIDHLSLYISNSLSLSLAHILPISHAQISSCCYCFYYVLRHSIVWNNNHHFDFSSSSCSLFEPASTKLYGDCLTKGISIMCFFCCSLCLVLPAHTASLSQRWCGGATWPARSSIRSARPRSVRACSRIS